MASDKDPRKQGWFPLLLSSETPSERVLLKKGRPPFWRFLVAFLFWVFLRFIEYARG